MPETSLRRMAAVLLLVLALALASCSGGGGGSSDSGFTKADYQFLYTYNASHLSGHTIRWANVPIGVSAGAFADAQAAFNRWASASGGAVSFNFGGNNITASWTSSTSWCGLTTINWSSAGRITSANISIARSQSGCAGGASDTLAHEAGHALGFLGHDASGLMNPFGGEPISDQEGRFMKLLYSLAPGTDISGNLGKARSTSGTYDKSGSRMHTMTISRSK